VNLMLSVLVLCAVIGLFVPRFNVKVYGLLAGIATAMTMLYYVFPLRFM
jgi:hypothetical protein